MRTNFVSLVSSFVQLAPVAARGLARRIALVLLVASACTPDSADPITGPDAAPPPTALALAGRYTLTSTYALATPPPELAPLVGELASATDGVDDPTAYLVDLVIAELPEGSARSVATVLAPYIASDLHARIAAYAPNLVPALRAMATGATRIATRFATIEDVVIAADPPTGYSARGRAHRTVRGVRVDNTEIAFASIGLPDTSADVEVTVELVGTATRAEEPLEAAGGEPVGALDDLRSIALANRVTVARHSLELSAGAWFRAAFDRAVIPAIVPGATDLASALRTLVDCPRLGGMIADAVGIGTASLYAHACSLALAAGARAIYARFPTPDAPALALDLVGIARASDRDGNGAMDAIEGGVWSGRLGGISVGASVFEGSSR